jgi:hypothetical protein
LSLQEGSILSSLAAAVLTSAGAVLLFCALPAGAQPGFQYEELDGTYYAYERDVGDMDGDGDNDVVAVQEGDTNFQLFRAPNWTRSTLVTFTGTYRYPRADDFKVADIDGDGDLDLVTGLGEFPTGNTVQAVWCENLGNGVSFSTRVIGNTLDYVKDIVVADLDRDGRRDVVMRMDSQTQIWLQETNGSWTEVVLSHPAHEGLEAGDLDRDGDADLILNGFWFATPNNPAAARVAANYTQRTIDGAWFNQGGDWTADSCKVVVGDFDGDGTNDVALSQSERAGYDVAWYRSSNPNGAGPWVKRVVTPVDYCHNLQAADFNLDGKVDLLVGGMIQSPQRGLKLMLNQGGGDNWTPLVIQTNGSYSAELGDIDQDGDLDIVGIRNWDSGPTWIYRNNAGGPPSLDFWSYKEVSAAHERTFSLCFPDVNSDSQRDIASGPFVYLNPGPPLTGTWTQISLPGGAHAFATLDVDGDNLADLIAQKDNPGGGRIDIYWIEASNAAGTSWATPILIGDVPRGNEPEGFQGYAVAQLIAGGRPEIIVNSPQGLYYFNVPVNNPEAGNWPRTFVAANNSEEGIGVADLDNDGDQDISFTHGNPHEVKWARNPGDGSADWNVFTIGEFPEALWPDRCAATDLNGDGRVDIIVTEENYLQPATADNLVCWWEQPASSPTSPNWVRHTITGTQYTLNSLDVGDVDKDGDVDLVLAEHRGSKRIGVWENNGQGQFTEHRVDTGKESHLGGRLVDLDGDGDLDLVSIAYDTPNQLHLWRNDGRSTTRPTIESVAALGATTVRLVFSERVEKSSAQLPGNYSISKGVLVAWALLGADGRTVTLITSPLAGGAYTVTVNRVTDQNSPPNPIAPDSQAQFSFASPATGITFDSATSGSDTNGDDVATLAFAQGELVNGYVVVGVSIWDPNPNASISSASYDGVPMTFLGVAQSASAYAEVYLYGLAVGDKAAGNYAVALMASDNVEQIVLGVASFSGVLQTVSTGPFASAVGVFRPPTGASRSPFVNVSSASGDMVVDMLGFDDGTSSVGSGQVLTWKVEDSSSLTDGVASRKSATAAVTSMSHTVSFPGVEWAIGAIALKRAAQLPLDATAPAIAITAPAFRARFTSPTVTARGTSSDARGVAVVEYRLENAAGVGEYQPATGTTAWSASVSGLTAGSNTIRVRARDFSGNLSSAVERSFTYVVLSPFTALINGNGTVSPNRNGQALEIGRSYVMTGIPAFRHIFAGWSGGITSPNAALALVMQSNLTVQANFVTNPFVVLKGAYYGLFGENNQGRNHDRSGYFTLALTERGSYSGSILMGSRRFAATGQFDWLGHSRLTLRPPGSNSVTVEMKLDVTNLTSRVEGVVGDGNWQAELTGYRAPTFAGTNSSPSLGRYTLAIPGEHDPGQGPGGHGYGLVSVGRTGLMICTGRLPDGTVLNQAIPVSSDGSFPLFGWLYGGMGSVSGWVTFTNQAESDLRGALNWIKRPVPTSRYYPLGFTNDIDAMGSRYIYSGTTQPVLNFTNGVVEFSFGNLIQPFTNDVRLSANGRVTNLSSNRLTLGVTPTTGMFTGTATDPNTGRLAIFSGALLQKQNAGVGYFLGTNQSGRVTFRPAP